MSIKWMGAALILLGCGGYGFTMAALRIRQEQMLRQLCRIIDFMMCELNFRLTPLPQLCAAAATQSSGQLGALLAALAEALDRRTFPDAGSCMDEVLTCYPDMPAKIRDRLHQLGNSMGRFDLEGQLRELDILRTDVHKEADELALNRSEVLRSYQTLGICAGAALAILLI